MPVYIRTNAMIINCIKKFGLIWHSRQRANKKSLARNARDGFNPRYHPN